MLAKIAALGDIEAQRERVIREIIRVDSVSREDAASIFKQIEDSNRKKLRYYIFPTYFGIFSSICGAGICLPMVFQKDSAVWFNEIFVTKDLPAMEDFETCFEVGAFTWNYMDPILESVLFIFICLHFARAQLKNIGIVPNTFLHFFKRRRSARLCKEYPQYDASILQDFSEGDPLIHARQK
ncbi:hypothetical protein HK099_008503 [Clydaea vesicula]|uniref:Uncharacterized protein n=1 Tax=Clydaea vesicula TaxID=447962 RepID=A0AAD5Y095_9FUNG|nr:hypothetical protein HK099_008503 [Clydaea vesicula]